MKKGLVLIGLLLCFVTLSFQIIAAAAPQTDSSIISNELKKVANYAEDYEGGNINYAQLLVYISAAKQNIDVVLKDIYTQTGTPISQSQIEDILGPSTGTTDETWSMWQQKLITLDESFPTWEKTIFDGRDMQIVVNVHPDMGLKDGKEFPGAIFDITPVFKLEVTQTSLSKIQDMVDEFKTYDQTPTDELARQIAKEIGDLSSSFRSNSQESGNCEKEMQRIFGSETSRNEVHSFNIRLKEDQNSSVDAFFQYCDGCNVFGSIDLKFTVMSEGTQQEDKEMDKQQFMGLTDDQYEQQIKSLFEEFIKNPDAILGNKISALTHAWLDSISKDNTQDIRNRTYAKIKELYIGLFADYPSQESVVYETEYSKEIYSNGVPNFDKFKNENASNCKTYPKIECDGDVIIKGKDANGCPLEPICMPKNYPCAIDSDCAQPLCGKSQCVNGQCSFNGLGECKQSECNDGDKDYMRCVSGEVLVRKLCTDGRWKETGQQCISGVASEEQQSVTSEEVNTGCNSIADCNTGEVCSSGKCVLIQEKSESNQDIIQQVDELQPQASATSSENSDNTKDQTKTEDTSGASSSTEATGNSGTTGNIIRSFLSGYAVEDTANAASATASGENATTDEQQKIENEKKAYENSYGRVALSGTCWTDLSGKSYGDLYFNLEGKFGVINDIAKINYDNGNNWCLGEVKQSILARRALENSLNNDFAKWFFEDYLANNANEWQRRSAALQNIYSYDMKLSEIMAGDKDCSGDYKLPEFNLINVDYETSFGSFKFWEKELEAKVGRSKEPVKVVAPYMTSWIFPSKEIVEQSMINDPSGSGNVDQPYRGAGMFEESNELEGNQQLADDVGKLIDKYSNGKDSIVMEIKFIDPDNNKIIMQMPISFTRKDISMVDNVNPQNIIPDITVNADFNQLYDLIAKVQRENKEKFIVYPSYDKSLHIKQSISEFVNAIELKMKINNMISSIETTPESAKEDVVKFIKDFMSSALGA
jgi:hypothetical protein